MKEKIKLSLDPYRKYAIILIAIFICIRIPTLYFPDFWNLEGILTEAILNGNRIYCDFDRFPLSSFWQEHVFPPGAYVYFFIKFMSLKNITLLLLELINILLLYLIITKFYNKETFLFSLTFLTFFPISLINTGYGTDPMQISLVFILLSYYLFLKDKKVFSSISLAIGTLIIYIPAIVLIPIIFYYFKNKKISELIIYLATFIIVLIIGIIPFALACPESFITNIYNSLNEPHSSSLLRNDNFFLTPVLYATVFSFGGIDIKLLNLIQIISLLLAMYVIYKRFSFTNKKDILPSSIILIILITILTFYIHLRFFYWILILSCIIFSFTSTKLFEIIKIKKIIFVGIVYFIISFLGLVFSYLLNVQISNFNFWMVVNLILLLYAIGFLLIGGIIEHHYLRILIYYSNSILVLFIFSIIIFEIIVSSIGEYCCEMISKAKLNFLP